MALCRTCLLVVFVQVLRVATGGSLYGQGCEQGWLHYEHFCYQFCVNETSRAEALAVCEDLGGDLASVWTQQERVFITDTLWQPKVTAAEFAWFGLHGTQDNGWAYLDRSTVIMTDGVLTSTTGQPATTSNRCGAFMGTGALAFLDCSGMTAQGFICKKALPRVFATSALVNYTAGPGTALPPLGRGKELYERVWPPLLLEFPRPSHYLVNADTNTETDCAFRCYNVDGCKAFQVQCITADMCKRVRCILLSQI